MQETLFKSRDERQEEARIKWIKNKCKGTWVMPTGLGKTWTAIKAIKSVINKYPEIKFIIVVPTDNLKVQWESYIDNNDLTFNGSVEIINTVAKRRYKTDILCIDEIHVTPGDVFQKVFTNVEYRYILGLTATFERLDGKEKLIEKYCPVIDKISLEEAILNNWVASFKEYQVLIDVNDISEYKEFNRQFTEAFEYFQWDFSLAMSMCGPNGFINRAKYRDLKCPNGTDEQRKAVFKQVTYYATLFMRMIQKRKAFINNHPKKIELARRIIEARPNSKIITFSNNIKMAESIGMGEVYTGKDSKKKARANLEEFNLKDTGVIHSCAKLIAGADLRKLSVAIMLGIDSSELKATQKRGRVVRFEEGKTAEIFNLVIDQTVETEWMRKSHKNTPYITIDEEGLNDVLAGREPKPYVKKIKDFQFRY